jgi:hypothetical protein
MEVNEKLINLFCFAFAPAWDTMKEKFQIFKSQKISNLIALYPHKNILHGF